MRSLAIILQHGYDQRIANFHEQQRKAVEQANQISKTTKSCAEMEAACSAYIDAALGTHAPGSITA